MTKKLSIFLICLLAAPTLLSAGLAEVSCDDRARMMATLKSVLGAERRGSGLRDPETHLEIWVAQSSGDWLLVQNYSNGTSCIVAMGENWEAESPGPA